MKQTKKEKTQIIKNRITKEVTAGGGSGYYDIIDPMALAEYLYDIQLLLEAVKKKRLKN